MVMKLVSAAKAKAQFLKLLDTVARTGRAVVVTKRGKPVARIAPLEREARPRRPPARILGDLVTPVPEHWEVG